MIELFTDESQSDQLIKAGINPDTADIFKTPRIGGYSYSTVKCSNSSVCWSIAKLLKFVQTIDLASMDIDIKSEHIVTARGGIESHFIKPNLISNLVDCVIYYKDSIKF